MKSWLLVVGLALAGSQASAQEVTGTLRGGVYADSDRTQVIRTLAAVDAAWASWHLSAKEGVDIVSSASLDVRSSTAIDAMSNASSLAMTDRRFETVVGGAFDDHAGHTVNLSLIYAVERDYASVGGAASGSFDLLARNTTLLWGVNANHNSVSSILDPSFHTTMNQVGYSVGVAQVLSQSDVARLRYDGAFLDGDQTSPYRTVRFGDWWVSGGRHGEPLVFNNTLGSADGLPERLPDDRSRHALVGEWNHALSENVALATQLRVAHDSWGIDAAAAKLELRIAANNWQLQVGYRFYLQGAADFFRDKYTEDPMTYEFYTSDKELGDERRHTGNLEVSYALHDWPGKGTTSHLDLLVDVMHDDYPGFVLLRSRNSVFGSFGLRIGF